ncbi:hypothetical protein ACFSTC_61545 [Nonomuraea ferruginea]
MLAPRIDDRLAGFLEGWRPPVADPDVAAAYELLVGFILGGGKRIRPQLCYWGWRGAERRRLRRDHQRRRGAGALPRGAADP